MARDQRQIGAADRMIGELPCQPLVRRIGLGYDQQAGSVLVDAMDDTRPRHAADARQLSLAMVQQGIDQRAVEITGGGMDDEAGGLVHDDETRVLVDDPQGNALGLRGRGDGRRPLDLHRLSRAQACRRAGRASLEADEPGSDEVLKAGAALGRELGLKPAIETLSSRLGAGGQAATTERLFTRYGQRAPAASTRTMAMDWDVERRPPSTNPRAESPRKNSMVKRATE